MNSRHTTTLLSLVVLLASIFFGAKLWTSTAHDAVGDRYVVIVSLDGFRGEYLTRAHTPALDAMGEQGVRGALTPCFPSNTFPNHYSMVTGLYPQNHGIVNNTFWDFELNDFFKVGDLDKVQNPKYYWGEPIWNTAERQGVKTGSYYWVGSEAAIQGMRPSYWKVYDSADPFLARADSVLAWLQKPLEERPRLITWYLQEPDAVGHHNGTQSDKVISMCEEVDNVVGYFRSELAKLPIAAQVDFIVVSDHGMADYDASKVVNLNDYLPRDSFSYVAEGVPGLLYTKTASYADEVVRILKDVPYIDAYRTADVPERFHYSRGERLGDVVVIPEVGGYVYFREDATFDRIAGHGFDNQAPEMQAIFFAEGPSFARGKVVPAVPNITIYPLLCRLLGITPAPHDATEADVDILLGK